MTIRDEQLMAYVDGELSPAERATIDAAIANDPVAAQRVVELRQQRDTLRNAFAAQLEEEVPQRLIDAARSRGAPEAPIELASVRARRNTLHGPRRWLQWSPQRRASARMKSALAATLLLGVLIGRSLNVGPDAEAPLIASADGQMVAAGALATALDEQSAGTPGAIVAIGLTYRTKSAEYCRTFATNAEHVSGIACRARGAWNVRVLSTAAAQAGGEYRMAGSALPREVIDTIEQQIDGEPLDAREEAAAMARGWRE
jgi:hypothetical protein